MEPQVFISRLEALKAFIEARADEYRMGLVSQQDTASAILMEADMLHGAVDTNAYNDE